MIDLGDFKLYARIKGEGSPTVIFENALGGTANFIEPIQEKLSEFTKVVIYDRAGGGKSEKSPHSRTSSQMAKELHLLLEKGKITPPYILVGSSYGAFIVRTFTHLYPEEVVGMVLEEPVHEDLLPEMKKIRTEEQWQEYIGVMNQMAAMAPEGPKQEWAQYFPNSDFVREINFPNDIPITIFTSTRYGEQEQQMSYLQEDINKKLELHKQWMIGKPNMEHITTEKSGHNILQYESELVIDAITNIINKAR